MMGSVVVGFEGRLSDEEQVAWGTAALRQGDKLLNPVTEMAQPWSAFDDLVTNGHIVRTETEIALGPADVEHPLVLLAVRKDCQLANFVLIDRQRAKIRLVKAKTCDNFTYWLFSDLERFTEYADTAIGGIVHRILEGSDLVEEVRDSLLALGTVLDSTHPTLNALRAYLSGDQRFHELYRRRVRSKSKKVEFETFLRALRDESSQHVLKYSGGATQGGGMDVGDLEQVAAGVNQLGEVAIIELRREFSCFTRSDESHIRCHELKAASATFTFAGQVDGETLLERVIRHLTLSKLASYLEGKRPQLDKGPEKKFSQGYRRLTSLSKGTSILHGSEHDLLQSIAPLDETEARTEAETWSFKVLGFLGGLKQRARKAEVHFSGKPGRHHTIPTDDDGDGGVPRGLLDAGQLWKPALIEIVIRRSASGDVSRFVRGVSSRGSLSGRITAIPSSVGDGFVLEHQGLAVEQRGTKLYTNLGDIELGDETTQESAEAWYGQFLNLVKGHEYQVGLRGRVQVVAAGPVNLRELEKLMFCVSEIQDGADELVPEDDICDLFAERWNPRVQTNNALRPSRRPKTAGLFVRDKDARLIGLSDSGRGYLAIYNAFVAATQVSH